MPDIDLLKNDQQVEQSPEALQEQREQVMMRELVDRSVLHITEMKQRLDEQTELTTEERQDRLAVEIEKTTLRLDDLARLDQERREAEQQAVVEELGVLGALISPPDLSQKPDEYSRNLRARLSESLEVGSSTRPNRLELALLLAHPNQEELSSLLKYSSNTKQLLKVSNWILEHPSTENLMLLVEAKKMYSNEAAALLLTRDLVDEQLLKIIESPLVSELRDQAISQLDKAEETQASQLILERGSRQQASAHAKKLLDKGSLSEVQLRVIVARLPELAERAAVEMMKGKELSEKDLLLLIYRSPLQKEKAIDLLLLQKNKESQDLIAIAQSERPEIREQAWKEAKLLIKNAADMGPFLSHWPEADRQRVWDHFESLKPTIAQMELIARYPLHEDHSHSLSQILLSSTHREQLPLGALSYVLEKGKAEQALDAGRIVLEKIKDSKDFGMREEIAIALIIRLDEEELQRKALEFTLSEHPAQSSIALTMTLAHGTDAMKQFAKTYLQNKTKKNSQDWQLLLQLDQSSENALVSGTEKIEASLFPLLSEQRQQQVLERQQNDPLFIRDIIPYVKIGWIRHAADMDLIWGRLMTAMEDKRDQIIITGYTLNRYYPDVLTGGLTVRRHDFDAVLHSHALKHYLQDTAPDETTLGESFSIIKSIIHNLKASNKELSERNITGGLDQVHKARQRHLDSIMMDEHTKLILATHQERRFDNEQIINLFEAAGFDRSKNLITSVKGMEMSDSGQNLNKQAVLEALRKATSGRTTFVFSGHGTSEAIWFSDGAQATSINRLNDERSISYQELGAALISSGNVENIQLMGLSCLSYDFMMNLNGYLATHLPEGQKDKRPIMISSANKNSLSSGGGLYIDSQFLSTIKQNHQTGQPLRMRELMGAEATLMLREDPAIFVPDAKAAKGVIEMAKLFKTEEGEKRAA